MDETREQAPQEVESSPEKSDASSEPDSVAPPPAEEPEGYVPA